MKRCLDIVIVNWNSGEQLYDVVSSIVLHHAGIVDSVIVVDNDSSDGSLERIESEFATLLHRLKIIRNDRNRGFGAACNQGAVLSGSELLLFLNPDTKIYQGSLAKPVEFLLQPENCEIGIVGIQLVNESGEIARSCARFPSLTILSAQAVGLNRMPMFSSLGTHMSNWTHDSSREVDHVIGAFYLIRGALFRTLGGFDELFFIYLEDLDLSLRARKAGSKSFFLADARAFHAGGGTSRQVRPQRLFYSLRSRLLYGFKHFSTWQAWVLMFITLAVEPLTRTVFSVASGDSIVNTWRAYGMLYRDIPSILRQAGRR